MARYQPDAGFFLEIQPVPHALLGLDGWLDPHRLATHARQAITQTIGMVLAVGQGSQPLTTFQSAETTGLNLQVIGGEWRSEWSRTPPTIRRHLEESGLDRRELRRYQWRRVIDRYWTERHPGLQKPGECCHALVLEVAGSDPSHGEKLTDDFLCQQILADLIERLYGGKP